MRPTVNADRRMTRELRGSFISPESGNRHEAGVMASTAFTPEIAEEEQRLTKGDRLRHESGGANHRERQMRAQGLRIIDNLDELEL